MSFCMVKPWFFRACLAGAITAAFLYADTAQAQPASGKVVWQLGGITFKDAAPAAKSALRVDDQQADASGGFVRITALNDGECAPGAGMPATGITQRFLFRWTFDHDVSQLAHPGTVSVRFTIEAEDNLPCFDLNPIMTLGTDQVVLKSTLDGARFYWKPAALSPGFHAGDPRVVEVYSPESGLERSNYAHKPFFKIAIWGFRGNRGMQLEATYPYALVGGPQQ